METSPKKRGALYSPMGRPPSQEVLSTFSPCIKETIIGIRQRHPGWGARTIHAELQKDYRFSSSDIPSIRSIGYLLKVRGLVRSYDKHVPMPESQVKIARRAHQVWQVDAQGSFRLENIGPIAMINIKDVYSLIYCMSYPNLKKSIYGSCSRLDYQCALRLAFMEWGLPEMIQTDHESIFHENKGKSPFPTQFHLWLIGLGIKKAFSRLYRPTDQAVVERMHQTMEKQAIQGVEYSNWEALFNFCQQRRKFLNQVFPCASLNSQPPEQAFPEARHSGRYYHPVLEEKLIDLGRIYTFLEKGKWYRSVSKEKSITLGGVYYRINKLSKQKQLMITFDRKTLMLSFHDDKEHLIDRMPIKGINKKTLMGDTFWKLSNVQLELPLSWETQKLSTTFLHNT